MAKKCKACRGYGKVFLWPELVQLPFSNYFVFAFQDHTCPVCKGKGCELTNSEVVDEFMVKMQQRVKDSQK